MLDALRSEGLLKVEAFVAWLGERGVLVDRTLVSHWIGGRAHLPADVLPWLARFCERPERVFGRFVRAAGCEVVRLPDETVTDRELIDLLLEAAGTMGRVHTTLLQARAWESPGGTTVTASERQALAAWVDELMHQLAELRHALRSGPGAERVGGGDG